MTEYWVSQGNKWCDTCKIFISNNPASIRNHELGQRHKENVANRLNTMRKDKATKEKEQERAARVLEQIEARASHSYQKDLASFQEAKESNARTFNYEDEGFTMPGEWDHESSSGYYYNKTTGYYYDPNSGFYYTDALGKWVTQEEAVTAFRASSGNKSVAGKTPPQTSLDKPKAVSGPPPGRVVTTPVNPMRSFKTAPSSVAVKRKRPPEKPTSSSKEDADALKAREAARKRVEDREKPLLGLYRR